MSDTASRKPQAFWAMIDEKGYIYPHFVRSTKKEVIAALDEPGGSGWHHMKSIGRKVVKICAFPFVEKEKEIKTHPGMFRECAPGLIGDPEPRFDDPRKDQLL